MEGGRCQHQEDPGGQIIQALPVFCIQFVCKGLSGLSESFEVDGLVVKVSGQFWRNWRAPKAQASKGGLKCCLPHSPGYFLSKITQNLK